MSNILYLLTIDVGIPLIVFFLIISLGKSKKKNIVWVAPVVILVGSALYLFTQINQYSNYASFKQKADFFFRNDTAMYVYLFIGPMLFVTTLFTLVGYFVMKDLIMREKNKLDND